MERANVARAILGGFIATLAMTAMIYAAAMMGLMKMDIAGMLGSMLNGGVKPEPMTAPWLAGMVMHFVNGSLVFPLIYAYLLYPVLAGPSWLRGLEWGVVLWFLLQALVMPMMGNGFFSANAPDKPTMVVMGSLMGHLVYGAVLGAIAGHQAARLPQARHGRPI